MKLCFPVFKRVIRVNVNRITKSKSKQNSEFIKQTK